MREKRPAERGQNLAEFALIFPILFLVLLGILDMGRMTYYSSALRNAVREGARYGSLFPDDSDGIITRVRDTALGMPADEVAVTVTASETDIQVSAAYTMPFVTPMIGAFFGGSNQIPLGSQTTNPLEN